MHGHSHGHVKILNQNYETIREVRPGSASVLDLHEFHIVDEKTALVDIYQPVPFDLISYGAGPKSQWLVDARFQGMFQVAQRDFELPLTLYAEIDVETGRLVFEWKSLDHVLPNGEYLEPLKFIPNHHHRIR